VLAGVYLGALWIQAAVYLPKEIVILVFFVAVAAFRQLRSFARDWGPLLLLLFLMDVGRATTYRLIVALDRPVVVDWPIRADGFLFGTLPTLVLQRSLHPTPAFHWYDVALAMLHGSHFVTFLVVGFLVWRWRPRAFRGYARAVLVAAYAGLAGYVLAPTAPPWLAALDGHLPPVARILLAVRYVEIPRFLLLGFDTNPVAAMPSLHAAFSMIVVLGLGLIWPRARCLAAAYPVALGFALVYGGEHYVADLLVGYVLGVGGFWLGMRARSGDGR
jgi:membrane-associated phospholipid phosphatase